MPVPVLMPFCPACPCPPLSAPHQRPHAPGCRSLAGNSLSGPLPAQLFSSMRALRGINVSEGRPLPRRVFQPRTQGNPPPPAHAGCLLVLLALQLSGNAFTGTLPPEWAGSAVRRTHTLPAGV